MNPADPVTAALAGLVLFFVPGFAFLALTRRDPRTPALRTDEALFVAVAASVVASAWVALVLAEAGIFSLVRAAALELSVTAIALVLGRRRLVSPLPRLARVRDLLPVTAVLIVTLGLHARPTEYIFGGRDPGTYVNAMALIARTGRLVVTDEAVRSIPPAAVDLFYRNPGGADFTWGRFMGFPLERPDTGRVFPEFFHLFPAFGAYLFEAMGTRGALATPPIFGVLGTLAVFFALRRVFSEGVALIAALLLAVNVLQVWFARYPVSEPMSQFLLFLALFGIAAWEESGSPSFGALAGVAIGLSLLVRIDSVLILAPLAVYVLIRRARRDVTWHQLVPVLVPLALLSAHGALHAAVWSRKYVLSIAARPYWNQPLWAWVAVGSIALAAAVAADRLGPRVLRAWARHDARLRALAAAALVLLAAYAYFLRPQLSAWAGADGHSAAPGAPSFRILDRNGDDVLTPDELAGGAAVLPAADAQAMDDNGDGRVTRNEWRSGPPRWRALRGFRHLAAHDAEALYRFGWFASPLGLALGLAGLTRALRRGERRHLLLMLLTVTFAAFYFYKMRVWNDCYFAMRRVIPIVLPGLLAWAAFMLVEIGRIRGPRRWLAAALGLVLATRYAHDTRPIARWTEWKGAVAFVNDVARRFAPQDVVIFEQVGSLHPLSLPLWAQRGVNVLELARYNPDPEKLRLLVDAWQHRYRNIYFVHTYRTDLCGVFLQRVDDHRFGAFEWERSSEWAPRGPEWRSWEFRISRLMPPQDLQVPPLPDVDIGGSDDMQVSGFFDKEGGGAETYRWTGSCASVYVPGAKGGQEIVIHASAGRRPVGDVPSATGTGDRVRVAPAEVLVSLSGVRLGTFAAGASFRAHRFPLPAPLPPGAPVLRFDVRAWRPLNVLPGSTDTRDLGVMIDRIHIRPVG